MPGIREQVPQTAAAVAELFLCLCGTSHGIVTIHNPVADTASSDPKKDFS